MTSRDNDDCRHDALSIGSPHAPISARPVFLIEPSADLLERARVGWERFLAGSSEVPDE